MVAGYPIGLARLQLWEVVQTPGTEEGQCLGQQTTLSNNTASGAYMTADVETSGLKMPQPEELEIKAGDKIVATHSFGAGKLSRFEISGPGLDTSLVQRITGANPNTSNSQATAVSHNPNRNTPRVLGGAITQLFKLNTGLQYYLTRMIPRAAMSFETGGATYRGVTQNVITVNPIKSTKAESGESYGTGGLDFNAEEDLMDFYDWITQDAFHIMAYRADGSATTFNTTYKPVSTVITLNAAQNRFYTQGTKVALSSITTAGLVTMAAAPTIAKLCMLAYPTAFVPA